MKWRRISEEEVRRVLASPEKIEPTEHGRSNAYLHTTGRYLKVTYKETDDAILNISVVDKHPSRPTFVGLAEVGRTNNRISD